MKLINQLTAGPVLILLSPSSLGPNIQPISFVVALYLYCTILGEVWKDKFEPSPPWALRNLLESLCALGVATAP
jgi:hypothetical protein